MPKICKYGCKALLEWDDSQSAFKETKTGVYHNKDRCSKLKENQTIVKQVTESPLYQHEEKQIQQQGQQIQPINKPSLEAVLLTQMNQALTLLKNDTNQSLTMLNKVCEEILKGQDKLEQAIAVLLPKETKTGLDYLREEEKQETQEEKFLREQNEIKNWDKQQTATATEEGGE